MGEGCQIKVDAFPATQYSPHCMTKVQALAMKGTTRMAKGCQQLCLRYTSMPFYSSSSEDS
jgi:hypothetical protein